MIAWDALYALEGFCLDAWYFSIQIYYCPGVPQLERSSYWAIKKTLECLEWICLFDRWKLTSVSVWLEGTFTRIAKLGWLDTDSYKNRHLCLHIISLHWNGTGSWNPSWRPRTSRYQKSIIVWLPITVQHKKFGYYQKCVKTYSMYHCFMT